MRCSFCRAENPPDATECSVCLRKMGQVSKGHGERFTRNVQFHPRLHTMIPKRKTAIPTAAGAILIINAILALGGLWLTSIAVWAERPDLSDAMASVNLVFGSMALFAMAGGVLSILRRAWGVTLIACIVSFFVALAFGLFFSVVEAMLSIAALVLLIQSRDEFARRRKAEA